MSAIDSGKYRLRKDWATASSASLVDIDEHADDETENSIIVNDKLPPQKPPRRSSLALGLFSSKSDKSQKRRSSIATAFLRRDNNKHSSKDSYESAVKQEKSDASNLNNSTDVVYSSEENIRASSPNEPGKITYFEDGTNNHKVVQTLPATSPYDTPIDKERNRRRRSSLQTKLDRRRRKNFEVSFSTLEQNDSQEGSQNDLTNDSTTGIGSSVDITDDDIDENHAAYFPRQKRHSWWNIFVPENIKNRSRRASQDASQMSRSFDNLSIPVRRSKSRSVDHGLAAPFDLDSLRSKVEGRFESVDRLSKEKKSSLPTIPTVNYTVGNRDTLTSVAARFDTTPSELTHLNRLNSSFIYPGQQLLVPDKSAKDNLSTSSTDDKTGGSSASGKSSPVDRKISTDEQTDDILESLRPGSPKPGHIERVGAKSSDDPVITQRFLKINVRHITDGQGVVGGVLLVTPNAVMFDPNVSDPLVIEHGPESYGVIAPMELCVNAAIFHDIAHMRVSGGSADGTSQTEKPEIYYPKSVLDAQKAKEGGDETDGAEADDEKEKPEGADNHEKSDDQESLCSGSGRETEKNDEKSTEAKDSSKTEVDAASTGNNDTENDDDGKKNNLNLSDSRTTLEERRKSLLDHHWAVPSKDRSSEDEGDNESNTTADSGPRVQDAHSGTSSLSGVMANLASGNINAIDLEQLEELSKQSCYDSGIDIREAIPNVQPIPKKTVYSDADIVLSSDWVPPKPIAITPLSESPPRSSLDAGSAGTRKKTSSVSFSVDDENPNPTSNVSHQQQDKNADKKNKMLKRLSYPLTWVEGLTGDGANSTSNVGRSQDNESAPSTGDSNQSVFSKVFSRRSSIGTFIRPLSSEGTSSTSKLKDNKLQQQPKLDYRSMVSVDDKPGLFVSVDKLVPTPARACPDPPLYLRLRMGKPVGKAIPLPTSVMSYGKNKLRPEYWFSVPKNRIDELYRFVNTWVPHLYGELDEVIIQERGFELIQDDTEWTESGTKKTRTGSQGEEITDITRESWEVLSMSSEDYRKSSIYQTGSFDLDFPIPDLIGTTEILTEEHREKLCSHLPARAEGYSWSLVFSTSQHGFSLNSLYRKMQRLESPVLIVIQDTEQNVFGALTSCSLHVSDHFYGTGESLLYKFNPSYKVFHWTGENLYFIKGNIESLSIGAGDGRFGLWLDGDLNQGRSQSCSTYGNEPLAPQEDFVIKTLECWAFV